MEVLSGVHVHLEGFVLAPLTLHVSIVEAVLAGTARLVVKYTER